MVVGIGHVQVAYSIHCYTPRIIELCGAAIPVHAAGCSSPTGECGDDQARLYRKRHRSRVTAPRSVADNAAELVVAQIDGHAGNSESSSRSARIHRAVR